MSFPDKFDEIWSGRDQDQLTIVEPGSDSLFCRWAQTLQDYATALIAPLVAQTAPAAEPIRQALLRLQRQYFRLRLQAPRSHRQHHSRRGHVCLHAVYEDAYRQLEALEDEARDRELFAPNTATKSPQAAELIPRPRSVAEAMAAMLPETDGP